MTSSAPFCPCTDHACSFNPVNHDMGCNLCVEDSIKCGEIPKCFFMKVHEDITGIEDWTFKSFADYVEKHQ